MSMPTRRGPVDPRVGGGDMSACCASNRHSGRSPRGRGRPPGGSGGGAGEGSIPAWAGETPSAPGAAASSSVDPRVGGGDVGRRVLGPCSRGRSPRGRGRLAWPRNPRASPRSIPAWAGETAGRGLGLWHGAVDPRVGGGDSGCSSAHPAEVGRSPRGRGRHREPHQELVRGGSIPAWAGETQHQRPVPALAGVDPRVGGGDALLRPTGTKTVGRSPRGRGRPVAIDECGPRDRSIPAWAGETKRGPYESLGCEVDPRVGGGDINFPRGLKYG